MLPRCFPRALRTPGKSRTSGAAASCVTKTSVLGPGLTLINAVLGANEDDVVTKEPVFQQMFPNASSHLVIFL